MELCTALMSLTIIGAYEFNPGLMSVEQWNPKTESVEEMVVHTDEYLSCWENPDV